MSLLVVCEGIQRAYCMVTALTVGVWLGAAAEQHDTVLYKGMECGMEMEISAKYLEGNDGFARLVLPHSLVDGVRARVRERWRYFGQRAMFLESDLEGGGSVGVANNNVAWLSARPDAGSGVVGVGERWQCCVPWCAKFVAVCFTQQAAAIVRQQWGQ
jgi:hypothetical protein